MRDQFKRDKCKEFGITLFEIPYYVKHKEMYNYISNLCDSHGYTIKKDKEFDLNDCYKITPKIDKANKIITEKGGKLITDPKSINMLSKFKIQCKNEHIWETGLLNLNMGSWCDKCAREENKEKISRALKEFYSTEEGQISKSNRFRRNLEVVKKRREEKMQNITEKKCTKCKETKEISNFCKGKDRSDGYQSYCRNCMNNIKNERCAARRQKRCVIKNEISLTL